MNVDGARKNVCSPVVKQSGIQCFNCKEFRHFAKECRKPKIVKDSAYHKENMLLCKQAEKGVPLQVELYDWLADTDEKIDEQELEAHYSYMAKIRELNETLGQLAQKDIEIKEGLRTKAYEISVIKEKHDELIKQSLLTKSHYEGLVKLKTKVITHLKLKEEHDIDKMLSMEKQLITSSTEQPHLKDKSMWSDQEKKIQKIDRLVRSILIQGLPNDIYSLIDSNKTAKDLWDALARHMRGSEYGEQDRKAAVFDHDLKKCGYSKDNCELNFKFLNNLQPEWKQYATMMRHNKNLMDINIDALYNILKQNQGDIIDAMGLKKKTVVVTSDPLALIAEKMKVSKRKEKVFVSSDSKGSDVDDFSELKKIIALLAKAFNRRKFYSKPTNNNLRTSSASQSANKKQEYVKSDDKKVEKKDDENKRDMSKVKCYNCKKE
nr:integrase, catalytic region, zinc finger, CCHC-type, peptidase aspartic, catalytic [Tanacetum cinerariifolium]